MRQFIRQSTVCSRTVGVRFLTEDQLQKWSQMNSNGLMLLQKSEFARSDAYLSQAINFASSLVRDGDADALTLEMVSLGNRGVLLSSVGRYSEADSSLRKAIKHLIRDKQVDPAHMTRLYRELAVSNEELNRIDIAMTNYRHALTHLSLAMDQERERAGDSIVLRSMQWEEAEMNLHLIRLAEAEPKEQEVRAKFDERALWLTVFLGWIACAEQVSRISQDPL